VDLKHGEEIADVLARSQQRTNYVEGCTASCVVAKPKAGLVQCRKGLAPEGETGRGIKTQDRVSRSWYLMHVPTGRSCWHRRSAA